MSFRISGIEPGVYAHLIGRDEDELARLGVERVHVTAPQSAPCRITLEDAEPGETVLLLSHPHQRADTAYRQSGPIFIRENASAPFVGLDVSPPALAVRPLSVRAYDEAGAMVDADLLLDGARLPELIERFWRNRAVAYAHAHYARRGCFAAAIERV